MMVTGTGMDFDETMGNLENLWCDLETQRFYCELPELRAFLPTAFIPKNQTTPSPTEPTVTEEVLDSEIPSEELEDDGIYIYIYIRFVLTFTLI